MTTITKQQEILEDYDRWREAYATGAKDLSIHAYVDYLRGEFRRKLVDEIERVVENDLALIRAMTDQADALETATATLNTIRDMIFGEMIP